MANELRVRTDLIGGMVEDNPLLAAATTLTSGAFGAAPVIGTTQHWPVVLDPDGLSGAPEIIYVTAHTAAATSATILRAREGTTARDHPRDTYWAHAITAVDLNNYGNGLIFAKEYLPGTDQLVQVSVTTPTVVDATNLKMNFTAPPSGIVLHRHTIEAFHDLAGGWGGMALLDAANALITGSKKRMFYGATSTAVAGNIMYQWVESGLTPGNAYERRLAGYVDTGRINFEYGPSAGGVTMTVMAVNV